MEDRKRKERCRVHQIIELVKKWAVPIWCPTMLKTRPVITPPGFLAVNNVRRIRMIHGDDFTTSESALSAIDITLVSPGEFLDHTLVWWSRRRREKYFRSAEYRWDFLIKFDVFVSYHKFLAAYAAFLGFDDFFSRRNRHTSLLSW